MRNRWILCAAPWLLFACGDVAATSAVDLGRSPGHCTNQDDCSDGSICEPSPLGAATGTCTPPSVLHCANCAADADCGAAGLCFQAPGDVAAACHVDCSLSWLACPSGYNCSSVLYGTGMRQVCLPVENRCVDAGGSACAASDTQSCTRTNAAGTCSGMRVCKNGQLTACDAPEPMFLDGCGAVAPTGCSELPSLSALSLASDCGACGNACPGAAASTADAVCSDPATSTCGISCRDDNYDVDGSSANGCEVADAEPGNHLQSGPSPFPSTDCDDSTSQNSFHAQLLSDVRTHTNPAVAGFNANVGAAPHWYSVVSTGGVCTNDYALTLTTTGGPAVSCYSATIITDQLTNSVTVTGAGSGSISGGTSSYSDNTTIYFKVEKTCSTVSVGDAEVAYTVSYHL